MAGPAGLRLQEVRVFVFHHDRSLFSRSLVFNGFWYGEASSVGGRNSGWWIIIIYPELSRIIVICPDRWHRNKFLKRWHHCRKMSKAVSKNAPHWSIFFVPQNGHQTNRHIVGGCNVTWWIRKHQYPLVNIQKLWKITIFNGKTHYKWPFSIAMLNYQRVTIQKKIQQAHVWSGFGLICGLRGPTNSMCGKSSLWLTWYLAEADLSCNWGHAQDGPSRCGKTEVYWKDV